MEVPRRRPGLQGRPGPARQQLWRERRLTHIYRWPSCFKAETAIFFSDHKRSEEHTSELQSLMRISYAVFCLKKKQTITLKHLYKHHSVMPIHLNLKPLN